WLTLQLATPVVPGGGSPFPRAAWANLRHGTATLDPLSPLGTLRPRGWPVRALLALGARRPRRAAAVDLSLAPAARAGHGHPAVAAAVTTFMLAGRWFEARAKRRAGAALEALLELGARDVAVLDGDGAERRVPVGDLAVGDRFLVRPGEKVATDGVVEEG